MGLAVELLSDIGFVELEFLLIVAPECNDGLIKGWRGIDTIFGFQRAVVIFFVILLLFVFVFVFIFFIFIFIFFVFIVFIIIVVPCHVWDIGHL